MRFWCFMRNATPVREGEPSPYELRFGVQFTGRFYPVGCRVVCKLMLNNASAGGRKFEPKGLEELSWVTS